MSSFWIRAATVILAFVAISACGRPEPLPQRMPVHPGRVPHAQEVQTWAGSETLRVNKGRIVKAARDAGADDARVSLILAAAMAETNDVLASQRDSSKDSMGPAKNFSAFNMNGYALAKLGWMEGQGVDLNQDCNLEEATRLFNRGLDGLGEQKFLFLHRGGETSFLDSHSYGCQEYAATIRAIADYLLQDTSRFFDNNRYGSDIPHV